MKSKTKMKRMEKKNIRKKKQKKKKKSKHHMFDFGQIRLRPNSISAKFDFGQLAEVELAEVEHPQWQELPSERQSGRCSSFWERLNDVLGPSHKVKDANRHALG